MPVARFLVKPLNEYKNCSAENKIPQCCGLASVLCQQQWISVRRKYKKLNSEEKQKKRAKPLTILRGQDQLDSMWLCSGQTESCCVIQISNNVHDVSGIRHCAACSLWLGFTLKLPVIKHSGFFSHCSLKLTDWRKHIICEFLLDTGL